MGVPAFFRWLSRKYPSIVVHCVEEKPKVINGVKVPVDSSKPNPNNVEFDNLYLDMNGIIHPCCHPENKPAPKDEDEMMIAIFEYIDRIISIVRPRRLLYMAIDGVAPRAKMNQQRSRRFRASKESAEKVQEVAKIRGNLLDLGATLPPEKPKEAHFDSNCITPGTPFMARLATCLHFYIHDRLNNDPGWRGIEVILSDANVPGEGEHKIMDFIRRQRANPDHDANTRHCLCGADADLIMLGLATHEPNFTIIREEFKPGQPKPCDVCGQIGHEMKDCFGIAKEKHGEHDELSGPIEADTEFIFIRLNVLREYLAKELAMENLPFPYDLERVIDDWVFMCFFVGNDFLPHLPSLEIREGAIDRLVNLYKKTVYRTGGFLTNSGHVELSRVQLIMTDLGEVEDEIFKRRQENEIAFRERQKRNKKRARFSNDKPAWTPGGQFGPRSASSTPSPVQNARHEAYKMRMQGSSHSPSNNNSDDRSPQGQKRKREEDEDDEPEPVDDVRLWEDGWKDRYYEVKFDVSQTDYKFRYQVAAAYVEGLCWVLRYYYQGCASWKWFFPYHYAPFASDFINIGDIKIHFEKGTQPFKPLEQLMGVFPAASKQHVPEPWAELMIDPDSPIIDFYPDDFKVDLNGKKYAWQGVALLPFVDEKRLLKSLDSVYPSLTHEELKRNIRGKDKLYVRSGHPGYDFLTGLYENQQNWHQSVDLSSQLFCGMQGKVILSDNVVAPSETLESPVQGLPPLPANATVCISYTDPQYPDGFVFPAVRLESAVDPPKVLKPGERHVPDRFSGGQSWRPQVGMAPATQRASLDMAGHRMLDHNMRSRSQNFVAIPPPENYMMKGSHHSRSSSYTSGSDRRQRGYYSQHPPRGPQGGPHGGGGGMAYWGQMQPSSSQRGYEDPYGPGQNPGVWRYQNPASEDDPRRHPNRRSYPPSGGGGYSAYGRY